MNLRIYKSSNIVISIVAIAIMLTFSIYLKLCLDSKIIDSIAYKNTKKITGITFNELNKLQQVNSKFEVTGYSEIPTEAESKFGVRIDKVKVVFTDEKEINFYPKKIIEGAFFDALDLNKQSNQVVISESMANKFFKTTKVIGNTIKFMEKNYYITGVYQDENKSMLYAMAQDEYERVYVPYSTMNIEGQFVDVLTVKVPKGNDEKYVYNELNKTLGDKVRSYKSDNYGYNKLIASQTFNMFIFIAGILLIIFIIIYVKNNILKLIKMIKEKAKELYFLQIIQAEYKHILLESSKILICIIMIFIVFNIIKFPLAIPEKYIPSDYIFDFNFYREAIISSFQDTNSSLKLIGDVYDRYISYISYIQLLLLACELIVLVKFVHKINRFRRNKYTISQ